MGRHRNNWIYILLITTIALVLILYYSLYRLEASPPSVGWSRALNISKVNKDTTKDFDDIRLAAVPLKGDNTFLALWSKDWELHYAIKDNTGRSGKDIKINYAFPKFNKIGIIPLDGKINIYGLSQSNLICYEFNYKRNVISSHRLISSKATEFMIQDNKLIYSDDKAVKLVDSNGREKLVKAVPAKLLDGIKAKDGLLYILITTEDDTWDVYLSYATFNDKTGEIRSYNKFKLFIEHRCELIGSTIGVDVENKKISLLETIRKVESFDVNTLNLIFSMEDFKNTEMNYIDVGGFNPNPKITDYSNGNTRFIVIGENKVGASSSNINVMQMTLNKEKIVNKELLTKTEDISSNPVNFTIDGYNYLVWMDANSDSKKINFASTNPEVYKMAGMLSGRDYAKLLIKTIKGIGSGLFLILLMSVIVVFPTILIVFGISVIALTWSEANSNKILNACIILQYIINIAFTIYMTSGIDKVRGLLPQVFRTDALLLAAVIITTSIAAYCVKNKYANIHDKRLVIEQYVFFAIINSFLYSLIFYPYFSL